VTTRTVAAFDFDGTLTRRDTMLPFLASVVGWPKVARALSSEAYRLARDRDGAKERVLARTLAGLRHDELVEAGRAYAGQIEITSEMRERIAWHHREAHDIVIVSASLELYLSEVARALSIEHALCTRLEVDDDARITGRLLGGNCRGPEKATRLRAHIGDDDVVLWAYGDSSGDREMLAMAHHPVRVRRGKLRNKN
jgi:phosphatidylglycerophosphatase C